MKPDLYTKCILTVIALMLTVIACKTVVSPETTANAQGLFSGVQLVHESSGWYMFFDSRNGDLWEYDSYPDGPCPRPDRKACSVEMKGVRMGSFSGLKLGQPIQLSAENAQARR